MSNKVRLGEMACGEAGIIVGFDSKGDDRERLDYLKRLRELGFCEGARISIEHHAPIVRDPIAVSVRGTLMAMRRHEANCIWVERIGK